MADTASEYTNSYTTFSGCDIACSFGSQIIGELQGISYSVTREKAPIYTMGSANPRSFSRGKRGIAGTLVFVMFDHDALLKGLAEHINKTKGLFRRIGGDANWEALSIDEWDEQLGRIALAVIQRITPTGLLKQPRILQRRKQISKLPTKFHHLTLLSRWPMSMARLLLWYYMVLKFLTRVLSSQWITFRASRLAHLLHAG